MSQFKQGETFLGQWVGEGTVILQTQGGRFLVAQVVEGSIKPLPPLMELVRQNLNRKGNVA